MVGYTGGHQFPGGKAGALVTGPGLVHPDMHGYPIRHRFIDRCQGRAPIDGGQPASIAVGENVDRLSCPLLFPDGLDQGRAVPPYSLIGSDILIADPPSLPVGGSKALFRRQRQEHSQHPLHGPAEIDRRWSAGDKLGCDGLQGGGSCTLSQPQTDAVCGCRPDERRPADQHPPYRRHRLLQTFQTNDCKTKG